MEKELLKLKQEFKELRELFEAAVSHQPLSEDTLKRIFSEYFRNKEMLEELRFIRFSVITALILAVFGISMLLYLAE